MRPRSTTDTLEDGLPGRLHPDRLWACDFHLGGRRFGDAEGELVGQQSIVLACGVGGDGGRPAGRLVIPWPALRVLGVDGSGSPLRSLAIEPSAAQLDGGF